MSKFYTRSCNRFLIVLFTGLYFIISQSLVAQSPAFPGAKGAGNTPQKTVLE
ncbi:hypothetical protein [Terrimonas pollutisoli]|uniref:hypothetical protein n=1 Tax=Terrimonas pollutisoli TaxID=3034147 RepID=UPI0023EE27AF|nr:hypothetical protein [Terrimonas sp. H1YJ31]